MLPLDSPLWSELDAFFGGPKNMPHVLSEWVDSVGFDQEMTNYRELHEVFLHQGTTTNIAYAVVPWILNHLSRSELQQQASYLHDIGLVEFRRLTCGLHFLREGGEAEPSWLMQDYHEAIQQAQSMAEDVLDQGLSDSVRTTLWQVLPALFGNAKIAHKRMYGE